ncbi:response regulator [candidate division KSB1 bacterium]|nr:response regulator [candidate division KSB1 bacterium]
MNNVTFQFSERQLENLKAFHSTIISARTEIVIGIQQIFLNNIFDNTHILHPRILEKFGDEEINSFSIFFLEPDTTRVFRFGEQRAIDGLGLKSILQIHAFFDQLHLLKINTHDNELSQSVFGAINVYKTEYMKGYFQSINQQTLTQQKQLRQALSTALEGHRRELLIQKHALNTSINAVVFTDLEGNLNYVNPAFLTLWGYSDVDEVLGINSANFLRFEEVDHITKALKENSSWRGEIQAKRKDNTYFNVEIFASLIKDENSITVGTMASFVDISERKRLEAQFRQAQKMDALGQLAGGIAHDFNNMLTIVRGYLEIISMETDEESQIFKDVMQVKTAVDRGCGLTKQLRYFARETSGERVVTDLNELISESAELLKSSFPPEIEIELDLESSLWPIKADPSQISHVLMNFCVNARDAILEKMDRSDGQPIFNGLITLKTRNVSLDNRMARQFIKAEPGKYVRFSITDTGIGMTHETQDKIFEPFFSTKEKTKNTGLGLSMVYGIVEKHNGFIDIRSEINVGTTFDVYLPVYEDDMHADDERDKGVLFSAPKSETILVVDDERQVLTLLERLLKTCGYKVMTASNGKEAISLYRTQRSNIDLVILDMIMPEMRGNECFQRLKAIDSNVKVILNTGYTADDSAQDLLNEGVIDLLEKPFNFHTLAKMVENALHDKGSR